MSFVGQLQLAPIVCFHLEILVERFPDGLVPVGCHFSPLYIAVFESYRYVVEHLFLLLGHFRGFGWSVCRYDGNRGGNKQKSF